jgi:hypothetical protein
VTTVLVGPLEGQLRRLQGAFPGSQGRSLPDGTVLVTVPSVPLSAGWNQSSTDVSFVVPVGYPMARPDCFYGDVGLRLANGNLPMNAAPQQVPHSGETRVWFSWHLATWNPTRDTLLTYVRVIQDRLNRPV